MSDEIAFNRSPPMAGVVETMTPRLRRLVAPNPSPFTFTGTCSYIVGHGEVAIVDPGPDDPAHVAALIDAIQGERLTAITVTHTHRDHSPAAAALVRETGAQTYGAGPHRSARAVVADEAPRLDAAGDTAFLPDVTLADGATIAGPDWTLTAITTPGHCANHLAFSLSEDNVLLSGDHVMAWSTTIVAPPDGAMGDYMASLQKLVGRPEATFFPGHGSPVTAPQSFLRGLILHRRMRESSILARVAAGDATIPAIVAQVYEGLAPALMGAAALNTFAHLEDLCARGIVLTDGLPALGGRYWTA